MEWTAEKLQEAIQHDLRGIKFATFLEQSDIKPMEKFITDSFAELKHCYTMVLSKSKQVMGIDFDSLSDCFNKFNVKIAVERLREVFEEVLSTSATAPRSLYESSSRRDTLLSKAKRPDLLCRMEFIEFVIRCAVIKHEELPVLEAVEEFLKKNLLIWLPSMSSIRDFRVNELWTKSVHEVFMLNRTEILRSLDCYSSPLRYSCLVQIFMEDSEPPIVDNEADLIQAAVLSKMAVVKDAGHEAMKMSQYSEVEFYEVLARVVQTKC